MRKLGDWENDHPELWNVIVAVEETMDYDSNELPNYHDSMKQTSSPPIGDDFAILTQLTKRKNLQMRDVPADGNCFFPLCGCFSSFCTSAAYYRTRNTGITCQLLGNVSKHSILHAVSNTFFSDTETILHSI